LRGQARLAPSRPDVAVSVLTGEEVTLETAELDLLLAVPTDRWVRDEDAGDPAVLRRLADRGLLVSDERDDRLAELRARDERLSATPWRAYAALHRAMTAWRDVTVAVSEEAPRDELADTLARGSPAFVERYGAPPSHFHSVGDAIPLPPADRTGPLFDLLAARQTARGFDREAPLTTAELSTVLRYVWGCHGTARVGDELVVLKKTSPSGGSLHPIEVYPLVRAVEGIEPGLYHYSVEQHGLEPVERMAAAEAEALGDAFLGGQWYFASAAALFVMAARFDRSFWKYRDHDKAYTAILLDAGHLSQTFYLVCAELGLGAFVAGAINDATIDERLGLRAFEEGALVICGCGRRAPSGLEPRFEPYSPRGPA
jgi:putative peptide maturation dehydrogenase